MDPHCHEIVAPAFVSGGVRDCWFVASGSVYVGGRFVLARTAGVEVSDSPYVGRAEPANRPAIFDSCLEELDGFVVGGGVAGAWGPGA